MKRTSPSTSVFRAFTAQNALSALLLISLCPHPAAQWLARAQGRGLEQVGPVDTLPASAKRFALVVGVDAYDDTQITTLGGAANDARAISDALIRYAGFPQDQVILLASDQPVERRPTRGNILRRLSNLRGVVPREGMLLVSFAGHGVERQGQAFLLPSDAQVSGDLRLLEETAINVGRMREAIEETGVGQVMLILDSCRNDPAGRAGVDNPLTPAYTRAFDFDARNKEVTAFVTLYATAVGQRAYEFKEKRQGYFSWALVEALKGGAANGDGEVTLAGLIKYLQEQVPKRVRLDLGKEQRPFATVDGYKADELVVAAAGNRPPAAAKDDPTPHSPGKMLETSPGSAPPERPPARGAKSMKVLIVREARMPVGRPENPSPNRLFTAPFFQSLVKKGLDVTDVSDEKPGTRGPGRLLSLISRLRSGDRAAGRSIPSALVVVVDIAVTALEPYGGLNVTEANGTLEAIDTDDGKLVALERVSGVRGFGNNLKQAKAGALKNAGEGISEAFINLVAARAR